MCKRSFLGMGIIPVLIIFWFFSSSTWAQSPKTKLPDVISITAYDVGSTGYIQAAALADGLMKKLGVSIRIIPSGNDISRTLPVKNRAVHFCLSGVGTYSFAQEGLYDFATPEWGPQPLRIVWNSFPAGGAGLATAKDAGIKTPYDLKGKKLPWIPGSPASNVTMTAYLAFGNLTWNDVKKVQFPSYGAALKGLVEGTSDGQFTSGTAATLRELESSRRGIWWAEFPASDKEGWKRLQAIAPYMSPMRNYGAPGMPPEGQETMTYPQAVFQTYDFQDEDLVYQVTKAIDEGFPLYKDKFPAMPYWARDKAIVVGLPAPFHVGTVRYLKEVGVWNQDFETWQKKLLQKQEHLAAAWKAAVSEANKRGLKGDDFSAFWLEKHDEALR